MRPQNIETSNVKFHPSDRFSVGMEMEFQLINPENHDLMDGILPLMEVYPDSPYIKAEFVQNTVEVASPPATSVDELAHQMRGLIGGLLASCDDLGMQLCGAGSHPFYSRMATITPAPRYQAMEQTSGWLSHNQVTFATHVHLGLASGDEAVTLMRELKLYLPLLITLSANSPFWHGQDTRFAAFRHRVLAASRTYGTPPDFSDWDRFGRFLATMQRADILRTVNDIHWDLRPRPHLGTLEVRIMDAQPTLTEALSIAAFLRALARFLQATRGQDESVRPLSPVPWWSLKDNCFTASRFGIDAKCIANEQGDVLPLEDVMVETLALIEPYADESERPLLEGLGRNVSTGLPYHRQRQVYQETGSLPAVVASFSKELRADVAT
jgi:carboxylate-amine ligase